MNAALLTNTSGYCTKPKSLGCGDCACNECKSGGLGSYGKQIEWNTNPVINNQPWNRDGFWDCNDWMTWHTKVKAKYGAARANEVFLIWWNKQGFLAYGGDCYAVNRTFREWWKANKLPPETLLEYMLKPVDLVTTTQGKVIDTAGNVIDKAADTANDGAGLISSLTKVLKTLVPVVLVAGVAAGGYYVYKNYVKGNRKVKVGATV